MKIKWIPVIIILFLITACASPSGGMTDEEAISSAMTAIAETEEANVEEQPPTLTAAPTRTTAPTSTSKPPTETPVPEIGNFANPYPFDWKENATWWIEYEDWLSDEMVKYEFGITELVWGDDCWLMVQTANRYNDPPEEGTEYMCVKMWLKNIGDSPIERISDSDFATVSDGTMYDAAWEVNPSPAFEADGLFPGGEVEGWGIYIIKEGDIDPLFSFYSDPIEFNSLIQLVRP